MKKLYTYINSVEIDGKRMRIHSAEQINPRGDRLTTRYYVYLGSIKWAGYNVQVFSARRIADRFDWHVVAKAIVQFHRMNNDEL